MTDHNLLPDVHSFLFTYGDTLHVEFTLKDINDQPVDLATFTEIKSEVALKANPASKITSFLVEIKDAPNGVFEIFLTETNSKLLTVNTQYRYDVQLKGTLTFNSTLYDTIETAIAGDLQTASEVTNETVQQLMGMTAVPTGTTVQRTAVRRMG